MTPFHDYFGISWYIYLLIWSFIAIGAHVYQVGFIIKLIRLGKDDDRFNSWKQRMGEFLTDWLGQRKVVEDKTPKKKINERQKKFLNYIGKETKKVPAAVLKKKLGEVNSVPAKEKNVSKPESAL